MRGIKNTLKPVPILPPQAEEDVHRASMQILSQHGVVFESDAALDLFEGHGMKIDRGEQRVFLDPEFVAEQVALAPSQFTIHARNPENNVVIGGDNLIFAPVSGPPFIADRERGRRDATRAGQQELIRLSEVLDVMHHGCPEATPRDVRVETRHLSIPGPRGEIPVRVYTPQGTGPFPALVLIHGGGWVVGSIWGYESTARILANAAQCVVVSVEYRLAPEHKFPAAPEDCYAAAEWTAKNASLIGVVFPSSARRSSGPEIGAPRS